MRNSKIKHLFLLSSALGAGLGGAMSWISPAQADCTSYTPADGTTVTCSGSSTTSIAAQKDVTINFLDGAQHITAGSGARITENSEINLYGNAAITAGGTGLTILNNGSARTDSTITLNGTSSVTSAASTAAILINGSYSTIVLNDQSYVKNSGTGDGIQITGITINGHNTVIVGENASIAVMGSSANAVDFFLGSHNALFNYGTLRSVATTMTELRPSTWSTTTALS